MSRLIRAAVVLPVACLLPLIALHAQQPTPAGGANPPAAKDGVEAKEKEQASPKAKKASDPIERIKAEGLERSQVMSTLGVLTDVIGPRLTGSPGMKRANDWTRDKLAEWGLENAHLEPWGPFGRGWSLKQFSAQVVEPQCIPLIAHPKAWSPDLDGTLVAPVVYLDAKSEADLAEFKGKLKGAIVLTGPPRPLAARFEPLATRLTDGELLALADAPEPAARGPVRRPPSGEGAVTNTGAGSSNPDGSGTGSPSQQPPAQRPLTAPGGGRSPEFARKKLQFLIEEGAALLVDPSAQGDGGTLFVGSAGVPGPAPSRDGKRVSAWNEDAPRTLPQLVVAGEHYNRMVRMIERGESLKMAVDLAVQFHLDDLMAYNTIAEIPGTDLKNEVVMLGGHMDSWHSGTGATDNAAGVAVAMEAVRILKALDLKPRRTIRIALWSGEEQGLLGSRAYVAEHFGKAGDRPGTGGGPTSGSAPDSAPGAAPEAIRKPEHETFSAYYNLDHGTGKIRGLYLQGNEAVRPIFRKWLQPFGEMGARTLSIANTGGTDHQSFDGVGLPGFQFIQDWVDYQTRTHHSNQDVYDRIQADDMKQAAVIMAAFVYNTAMRDEKLPRKPAAAPVPGPVVPPGSVAAIIETTLSTASGQIRQFAFDGDPSTFFASEPHPGSSAHFTLVLDRPVSAKSIAVATGRADGSDKLDAGTLEVSSDGTTFNRLAKFADGQARGEPETREIRAIRIRPEADLEHALTIREFLIESDPPVTRFRYPVEFLVDVSDAPELKDWAERTARECERAYPMINEELKGEIDKPPHLVRMALKGEYTGVAAAHRDRITGSAKYFKDHPDDVGAMIHETTHIVQGYRGRDNPSWLVEGVADYVRFFKYEPGKLGRIDAERARYNGSYRVSAAFLAYLTEQYDKEIVLKLNTLMRRGEYKEDVFQQLTGKTVQELGEEWRSTLRR